MIHFSAGFRYKLSPVIQTIASIVAAVSLLSSCTRFEPDVHVDPAQTRMEARAMLGIDMYARGEFLEALDAIRPWAEQGNSSGMVLIAGMYYQGRGVVKDNVNAYMWAELGVIYSKNDEEYTKAINFRDKIILHLTREEIDEGQRRTKNWQSGFGGNGDNQEGRQVDVDF
ncbi:MAG: hypothetical protein CMM22_04140 [Rhodospirillaceae bacterium]|nr:hypothetical protein [Rhodospirillaceae bacterium]